MVKIYYKLIFIVIGIALIFFVWYGVAAHKNTIDIYKGKIKEIKTMSQLCTIEFFNEVVINDTIDNNVLCGIQKQQGSISFDLENLSVNCDGDTIKIMLSPEIIEIYESTDENSWEVIDTQDLRWYVPDNLSEDVENAIKRRIRERSIRMLYRNGVVQRARAEGAANLTMFMEKIYRKPVKVIDSTPMGAHYNDYK